MEKGLNINFFTIGSGYVIKARIPISRMGGQRSSKWATVELRLSIIKGIIANRCQNVGSFPSFGCGWLIVHFLVWHYSYWPMLVNYFCLKVNITELNIRYSWWMCKNGVNFQPRILHCALKQPRVGWNYVYAAVAWDQELRVLSVIRDMTVNNHDWPK